MQPYLRQLLICLLALQAGCVRAIGPLGEGRDQGVGGDVYAADRSGFDGAPDGAPVACGTTEGLVAHWRFDDGSGGTATDSSGNGHHGQLDSMDLATAWVPGRVGGALRFDGVDDMVRVPKHGDFDITDNLTVSYWAKLNEVPGRDERVITKLYAWDVKLNGNNGTQFTAGAGHTMIKEQHLGEWHHVVATFASGDVQIYSQGQEGTQIADLFSGGERIPLRDTRVYIGARPDFDTYVQGLIDEVRIYDRVLSAAEVAELYACVD